MNQRLAELLRQRALLQEHLAWLEDEIAEENRRHPVAPPAPDSAPRGSAPVTAAIPVAPAPSPPSVPPPLAPPAAAAVEAEAEAILEQYRSEPTNVKRGCYAYFFVAIMILGGALVGFYYFVKMRHGR